MLTIAAFAPVMACSLLFAPAEPGSAGDGGTKVDARRTGDGGAICETEGFTWTHRLPIAFDGVGTQPQTNVPVGIRFTSADFTSLRLPDDPSSLHFVEAGGNQMPHEVEAWDPDVGGLVWVLASNYPGAGDELGFDMYYGDPLTASSDRGAELWLTAGYSAVFHFNRDEFTDSINTGVEATIGIGVTATDSSVSDGFGHAMRFAGIDSATVVMAHSESHQSEEPLSMSLEARFQANHASSGSRFVIQKPDAYGITSSTTTDNLSLASLSALEGSVTSAGSVLSAQTWTHAAMNVNANTLQMVYFLDGAAIGSPTLFGARATSKQPLVLGSSFEGNMDELRISSQARLPRWFALQLALFTGDLQSFGAPLKCAL